MTPARVTLVLLSISMGIALLLAGTAAITGQWLFAVQDLILVALVGALTWVHVRGWRYAAHTYVVVATLATIGLAPQASDQRTMYAFVVLIPPVLATVLLSWRWTIGVFVTVVIGMALMWQGQGVLFQPVVFLLIVLQLAGVIVSSLVSQYAQRQAEQHRARAEAALIETQQAQMAVEIANTELRATNADQLQILQLISTLETPAVTIADGTVLVPIVGHLDTRRAADLNTRILQLVHQRGIRTVLLDLAGIAVADTHVARALNAMIQAIGLLGAQVVVTGITAETAMIFSELGIHFARTARSPQDALTRYVHPLASQQVLRA